MSNYEVVQVHNDNANMLMFRKYDVDHAHGVSLTCQHANQHDTQSTADADKNDISFAGIWP